MNSNDVASRSISITESEANASGFYRRVSQYQGTHYTIRFTPSVGRICYSVTEFIMADTMTQAAIDDAFNFDSTDDEDPFNDTNKSSRVNGTDKPASSPGQKRKAEDDDGSDSDLGIKKEVKITKKRKPIAKLDEAR